MAPWMQLVLLVLTVVLSVVAISMVIYGAVNGVEETEERYRIEDSVEDLQPAPVLLPQSTLRKQARSLPQADQKKKLDAGVGKPLANPDKSTGSGLTAYISAETSISSAMATYVIGR